MKSTSATTPMILTPGATLTVNYLKKLFTELSTVLLWKRQARGGRYNPHGYAKKETPRNVIPKLLLLNSVHGCVFVFRPAFLRFEMDIKEGLHIPLPPQQSSQTRRNSTSSGIAESNQLPCGQISSLLHANSMTAAVDLWLAFFLRYRQRCSGGHGRLGKTSAGKGTQKERGAMQLHV